MPHIVDGSLPQIIDIFLSQTLSILTKFGAVIIISPIFIIPGAALVIAGVTLGNIYMKAQLPVKRESSNAKAPVLGHFGAAISGLGMALTSSFDRTFLSNVDSFNSCLWSARGFQARVVSPD